MLSHGTAGIEPGRWAYATLPKPLDLEASDFTTAGSWPRFWSLEVRATSYVQRQDRRRIEAHSSRSRRHHDQLVVEAHVPRVDRRKPCAGRTWEMPTIAS